MFSVVGVNVGDICLQTVLLWKAYLGNNRSKIILLIGALPLLGIVGFIFVNGTVGRSLSVNVLGVCSTTYRRFQPQYCNIPSHLTQYL